MNRDEIRNLLGGYATGTLTEAEQKLLFEAALDDQELFDELSREQELKEMLEQPGARSRLIAALEPEEQVEKSWWAKPWPWAAAATVAMGVVIAVALWPHSNRVPIDLAANQPAAVPVSSPTPAATPASTLTDAAAAKPPAEERRKAAPAPAGPAASAPAIVLDRREQPAAKFRVDEGKRASAEPEKKSEAREKDAGAKDVKEVKDNAVREVAAVAPPPPPVGAAASQQVGIAPPQTRQNVLPIDQPPMAQQSQLAQTQGQLRARTEAEQNSRDRAAPRAPDQTASRAVETPAPRRVEPSGGGGAGRTQSPAFGARQAPPAAASSAKAKVALPFAFSYRFDGNGHLEIAPLADGFLFVTLVDAAGARSTYPLASQGRVLASRPVRIDLTDRTTSVDVVFAELNIARDIDSFAKQQLRSETKESGFIEDPTPSPNSRLAVTLRVPTRN